MRLNYTEGRFIPSHRDSCCPPHVLEGCISGLVTATPFAGQKGSDLSIFSHTIEECHFRGPLLQTQMHPTKLTKHCHDHFKAFVTALVFADLEVQMNWTECLRRVVECHGTDTAGPQNERVKTPLKNGQRFEQTLAKQDICMASKRMKRCSTS